MFKEKLKSISHQAIKALKVKENIEEMYGRKTAIKSLQNFSNGAQAVNKRYFEGDGKIVDLNQMPEGTILRLKWQPMGQFSHSKPSYLFLVVGYAKNGKVITFYDGGSFLVRSENYVLIPEKFRLVKNLLLGTKFPVENAKIVLGFIREDAKDENLPITEIAVMRGGLGEQRKKKMTSTPLRKLDFSLATD